MPVICQERGADCSHMVQLMPLHLKTPSSLGRRTVSMEQASDRAEAAAVDHYFSSSTENVVQSSLPTNTGKTDDCFVMCPRFSVGGATQTTQLQLQ